MIKSPNLFCVLARQRSGTNMLHGMLNQHPDVLLYNEVFLPAQSYRRDSFFHHCKNVGEKQVPRPLDALFDSFVRSLMSESVQLDAAVHQANYRKEKTAITPIALGFNLKYNQLSQVPGLTELLESGSISILHFVRKNLLRTYISHELLRARARLPKAAAADPVNWPRRVTLSTGPELLEILAERTSEIEWFHRRFEGKAPILTCEYEEFTGGSNRFVESFPREPLHRICRFLGVDLPAHELKAQFRKVNEMPLSETIINYQEVAETILEGPSAWHAFLESD